MPPNRTTADLRPRADSVIAEVTRWATTRPDLRALAVVGSWARGEAQVGSDIDLIALVDQPQAYREATWLSELDWARVGVGVAERKDANFGAVWSRHVRLSDGMEVEFSFGPPSWAFVRPLDSGTRRVLADGCRVLYDPEGLLNRALRSIGDGAGAA